MLEKLDGTWFARLDNHVGDVRTPMVFRDCTSFENGRAGLELWATRHQERLRREVAETDAKRPRHRGAGGSSTGALTAERGGAVTRPGPTSGRD